MECFVVVVFFFRQTEESGKFHIPLVRKEDKKSVDEEG